MTTEKRTLLVDGTPVRTIKENWDYRSGWKDEAWNERKWNVEGHVISYKTGHGLCYQIRHDDGSTGWYDPSEFQVLKSWKLVRITVHLSMQIQLATVHERIRVLLNKYHVAPGEIVLSSGITKNSNSFGYTQVEIYLLIFTAEEITEKMDFDFESEEAKAMQRASTR